MDLAIYLFKKQLKKIDLDTFNIMLEKNISFTDFFEKSMPNKEVVSSAIKLLGVDTNKITPSLIINCFAESNPAAYNLILSHRNGTEWLKKTMEDLKIRYS